MDEPIQPAPQTPPPASAPAPIAAEPASPYRGITAAILIAAIIVGASLMGSALYVGDKLDAVRQKLTDIGGAGAPAPARAADDEEDGPAKIDPSKLVADDDPTRGPQDAKITIVEFSDYECPFCERFYQETLPQLLKEYGDKIRFVFKDFPLPMHPAAQKAHEAALCAGEQGKYWEYHDTLFENRRNLGVDALKGYARKMGLNAGKFNDCLESGKFEKSVKDDMRVARQVGVNGTPTFFINGQRLVGAQPIDAFRDKIDAILAE